MLVADVLGEVLAGEPSRPNWAEQLTAWATLAAAVIVAATAAFAAWQLRDARRTRHAQLLIELSRRWDEPGFVDAQRLFGRQTKGDLVDLITTIYQKGGQEPDLKLFTTIEAIPNFWETLAILHSERAVSLAVADKMWGTAIRRSWAAWRPAIMHLRAVTRTPSTYEYFEELASAVGRHRRGKELRKRALPIFRARKRGPVKSVRTRVQVRYLLLRRTIADYPRIGVSRRRR